jgi:hypothetical protein
MKHTQGNAAVAFGGAVFFVAVGLCVYLRVLTFPLIADTHAGIDAVRLWSSLACCLMGVLWAGIGWYCMRNRRRVANAATGQSKP